MQTSTDPESPMTDLSITYTAPNSPNQGQQTAVVTLNGPLTTLEAVAETTLTIGRPYGETLHVVSPTLHAGDTTAGLVVYLPSIEQLLDLIVSASPSQARIRIKITIKKEGSKPDPPRRASLGR